MGIVDNLKAVYDNMADAAAKTGRDLSEIKLIAVTKTVEPERIMEAVAAGADRIGENRVQELLKKYDAYGNAEKHLIGQLQSNKVKKIVGRVALIHSVDRLSLAEEIDRCAREAGTVCPVLIEVNLGGEAQKGGVAPEPLFDLAGAMLGMKNLGLKGLMTVPPVCPPESARAYFGRLRELLGSCNAQLGARMHELSMGMSADYREGILEGATYIRVGTAIFGKRLEI